jgi:hypothetical protein
MMMKNDVRGIVAYASRRAVSRVVSTYPAFGMTADAARLEARATKAIRSAAGISRDYNL